MIRHIHLHEFKPTYEYSKFKYNGHYILKTTENVLLWKAKHAIPMNLLNDNLIVSYFPPDSIFSDQTNQKNNKRNM